MTKLATTGIDRLMGDGMMIVTFQGELHSPSLMSADDWHTKTLNLHWPSSASHGFALLRATL